jgi:hypothetical protein
MGNDFFEKIRSCGVPELARMPHALDTETVIPQSQVQEILQAPDFRPGQIFAKAHLQNGPLTPCHAQTRRVEGTTILFYKPSAKECAACHG